MTLPTEKPSHIDTILPEPKIITPYLFPPGSLGHELFPDVLDGRKRNLTVFSQPFFTVKVFGPRVNNLAAPLQVRYLFPPFGPYWADEKTTMADLLQQPRDSDTVRRIPFVEEKVSLFFNQLAAGPESFLIASSFGFQPCTTHRDLEQRRHEVVQSTLALSTLIQGSSQPQFLSPEVKAVVNSYFGLMTGIPYTVEEISSRPILGGVFKPQEIYAALTYTVGLLHDPVRRAMLYPYTPMPQESLGFLCGLVTPVDGLYEIPALGSLTLKDLQLSERTLKQLREFSIPLNTTFLALLSAPCLYVYDPHNINSNLVRAQSFPGSLWEEAKLELIEKFVLLKGRYATNTTDQ